MRIPPQGFFTMLRQHEGLRLESYQDTEGTLTIGYGHNLEARGITITEDQAEALLQEDVQDVQEQLARALPWLETALQDDPVRQAVILDMAFNLGIRGLLRFRKLRTALQDHAYEEAAREMLDSTWAHQVGRRATRLAKMMQSGEWALPSGRYNTPSSGS
jgi:lysozyme